MIFEIATVGRAGSLIVSSRAPPAASRLRLSLKILHAIVSEFTAWRSPEAQNPATAASPTEASQLL